jgi:cytidyltransferase-like protein
MNWITVSGPFDDLRFADYRFLEEAKKRADSLRVMLWSDQAVQRQTGKVPKFPIAEREYVVRAVRYVDEVVISDDALPSDLSLPKSLLEETPPAPPTPDNPRTTRKKVVVTGCFDWFHSGHIRFFEECSELGDLYVVVGHDANIRLLKGHGHPLFPALQRRYIVGAIRFVTQALISTGQGWMDAEPEFLRIRPDIYAVNEDGDKPEKRQFCLEHGIEYRVLRRLPKPGLAPRNSTMLRGF